MSNNKMYIAIIVAAAIITVISGIFLYQAFFGNDTEDYIPGFAENEPTQDSENQESGDTTSTDETDDQTEDPEDNDYDIPQLEHLALYGPITWHTPPTWDFHQVFNFNEGIAGVEYFEDGVWESMHILGYLNNHGEIIIPIEHRHYPEMYAYRGAPPFSQGLVAIRSEGHNAMGVFDTEGRLVVPFDYDWGWSFSEGLMAVRRGGWGQQPDGEWADTSQWGFIDQNGNEVIPLEFDRAGTFSDGLAPVMRYEYWGFINTSGEVVIPFTIGVPMTEGHGFLIYPSFSEGLAAVSINVGWEEDELGNWVDTTRWGFIDRQGNQVVDFIYTHANNFSYGVAIVRTGYQGYLDENEEWVDATFRWGAIDHGRNIVIPFNYNWIGSFNEGVATAFFSDEQHSTGAIDTAGNIVIPPGRYQSIHVFSEGMAAVNNSRWVNDEWVQTGWGFVDRQGNEVIPLMFDQARDFSQGFAAVAMGAWEETPSGEWVDNTRWGIIDREGNIVVPIIFNDVRSFSEGLAWVRYGELWGLVEIAAR